MKGKGRFVWFYQKFEVVFSGTVEDKMLQVGKFFITLPDKTVLQTIEGLFNV
jgi:hypothetical protein